MKKIIILCGLLMLVLSACEQNVTVDVPAYTQKLTVYCILYDDSIPILDLGMSNSQFDYKPHKKVDLTKANVVIRDENTNISETLVARSGQDSFVEFWGSNKAIIGHKYALQVTYNGMVVTSETRVPARINIDKMEAANGTDSYAYNFNMYFTDEAGFANAYLPVPYSSTTYDYFYNFLDSVPFGPEGNNNYSSDIGQDGKKLTINFDGPQNRQQFGLHQFYQFRLYNSTQATANFITSVRKQRDTGGSPFVEPVFIQSNIKDGLGLFGGVCRSKPFRVKAS